MPDRGTDLQHLRRKLAEAEEEQGRAETDRELAPVRRLRQTEKALDECSATDTVVFVNVYTLAGVSAHRDAGPCPKVLPDAVRASLSAFCAAGGACVLWGMTTARAQDVGGLFRGLAPEARSTVWGVGAGATIFRPGEEEGAAVHGTGNTLTVELKERLLQALLALLGAPLPRLRAAALVLHGGSVDLAEALPKVFPFSIVISVSDESVVCAVSPDAEQVVGPVAQVSALAAAVGGLDGVVVEERMWPTHRAVRWAVTGQDWKDDLGPLHFMRRRRRDVAERSNVILVEALHHRADLGPSEPPPPALRPAAPPSPSHGDRGVLAAKQVYRVVLAPGDDADAETDEKDSGPVGVFRDDGMRLLVFTGSRETRVRCVSDVFTAVLRDGDWARRAAGGRVALP
eukprot:TRINITY_DN23354_c0_g1_i1.p2 TRINITY_DN23354_c0_g1~~TRINITY_DN23354_c0_g1_i1.p2  ORF type:complete len:416 (+),score=102.76 TRINITY_DN23354_c0_g1_i1:51-1250(+)